jgi:hypothetical protein
LSDQENPADFLKLGAILGRTKDSINSKLQNNGEKMNPSPWYINPVWWAFLVSVLALVISIIAARYARNANKSSVHRSLVDRAFEINEAFLRHKVRSPISYHLSIPNDRLVESAPKIVLLLHQLNLLREVYEHQKILSESCVSSHINWTTRIVRPWIEADHDLRNTWKFVREHNDMFGRDFIKWLETHLPIT